MRSLLDKLFGRVMPPIVAYMARSGAGTNASLRSGALPLPVHYYSPVPDIEDLAKRDIWSRRSDLPGIDLRVQSQLSLIRKLGQEYGHECKWPHERTKDPFEFYTAARNFSYGCAAVTHAMIRSLKPKRVIEIGSGNSSRIIAAATGLNRKESGSVLADYTVIDPYPRPSVSNKLAGIKNLIRKRVELVPVSIFKHLESEDILFIDSGHTVRTGGDVNYLMLEVLPVLAPGVVIHFHDIPLPFEYPKAYFINPSFRVFWTEAYLLQAFLVFNNNFEVLLAMNYLMADHKELFQKSFPHYTPETHTLTSSSFWIQRKLSQGVS